MGTAQNVGRPCYRQKHGLSPILALFHRRLFPMANSAGNDIPKALEAGGEISPEDAERFAAAFRPSWELDDAPFTQAATSAQDDLLSLAADANTVVDLPRP